MQKVNYGRMFDELAAELEKRGERPSLLLHARIKIGFDVTCLVITACMTFFCLGHIMGLGIGTIVAAFTMGKGIAIIGNWMDQRVEFVSLLS